MSHNETLKYNLIYLQTSLQLDHFFNKFYARGSDYQGLTP
jgi:hypothetical protein